MCWIKLIIELFLNQPNTFSNTDYGTFAQLYIVLQNMKWINIV